MSEKGFNDRRGHKSLVVLPLSILLLAGCGDLLTGSDKSPSVESVVVSPDPVTVRDLGASQQFDAVARDEDGNRMPDVSFTWNSAPDSVVTVDDDGTATIEGNGSAIIEASASGEKGTARMLVRAGDLRWTEIKSALIHTCGMTTHGTALCRGDNVHGELGNGHTSPVRLDLVKVRAPLLYFKHITLGGGHTCAITHDNAAYCWGNSSFGEGGYGKNTSAQTTPVEVHGHHSFVQLTAGGSHTCGVTTDGDAYCWGHNNNGQLGDGTTEDRLLPVEVKGEHTFRSITAGSAHTCGLTPNGTALCWEKTAKGSLARAPMKNGLTLSGSQAGTSLGSSTRVD